MSRSREKYIELVRIGYRVDADILAAELEYEGVRFKLIENAETLASLMPPSQVPVIFHVLEEDIPRAKTVLETFRRNKEAGSSESSGQTPSLVTN